MALGKGIVASNLRQIGEVLKHDSSAILVKPGDIHELSNGIRALIEDPPLRQRLGQAARHRVLKDYTWAKHTARIIHKLEEMYL